MTLLEMLKGLAVPGARAQQAATELTALVETMAPHSVDEATREDVVQGVVLNVLTRVLDGRFEMQGEGQARCYLRKMVRSELVDTLRRTGREVPSDLVNDGAQPDLQQRPAGGASDFALAMDALEEAVQRAAEKRPPRWREPLKQTMEQAKALYGMGLTMEETLVHLGTLAPDAPRRKRVRARDRAHKAQERLREAVLSVADEMAEDGEREKAALVRLACSHLLRRRACQKRPSADVPGTEGGAR
ncbi:MAG: hypothetical protein R6V85_13175 [Polyangia bacterium]